jgi:transcription elongation factor Elf1
MTHKWQEWECPECGTNHVIAEKAVRNTVVTCENCHKSFKSLNALESYGFVYDSETE